MKSAESSFTEQQKRHAVLYMELETMFPDAVSRELAEAAGKGKLNRIDELVAKGAGVNSYGTNGATPLFWALRQSNIAGFVALLQLGADPNAVFADGSVMHWAARHEDIAFLRAALTHGGNPNLAAGKLGETPLFMTIGLGTSDRAANRRLLLESGADLEARTSGQIFGRAMGGKTPVMEAADLARFDVVLELLEDGADPGVKDVHGRSLVEQVASMRDAFVPGSSQEGDLHRVIQWLAERRFAR